MRWGRRFVQPIKSHWFLFSLQKLHVASMKIAFIQCFRVAKALKIKKERFYFAARSYGSEQWKIYGLTNGFHSVWVEEASQSVVFTMSLRAERIECPVKVEISLLNKTSWTQAYLQFFPHAFLVFSVMYVSALCAVGLSLLFWQQITWHKTLWQPIPLDLYPLFFPLDH